MEDTLAIANGEQIKRFLLDVVRKLVDEEDYKIQFKLQWAGDPLHDPGFMPGTISPPRRSRRTTRKPKYR